MIHWKHNVAAICWLIFSVVFLSVSSPLNGAEKPAPKEPWSWKPIGNPSPPALTENFSRVKNPIDNFLLQELQKVGLTYSHEASESVLVRRLYFTLHGLPPSPEAIATFIKDRHPDKWERLIDQLLDDPAYGERWARHWLDVVRYTESQGFEYDRLRDNAWHYRDYVIASFNADKPYNIFLKEQLAGDVIEPVTRDSMIATSMLVCGPWDEAGSNQANVKQRMVTREEELEDLVGVVSQTFLGSTMHCARCHDHKFDPIPQSDYYSLKAVFEGIRHGESSVIPPSEKARRDAEINGIEEKIALLQKKVSELQWPGVADALNNTDFSATLLPPTLAPVTTFGFGKGFEGGKTKGNAETKSGALFLPGDGSFFQSSPISKSFKEKTLEALVMVSDGDQQGGGVITVENPAGAPFDSIVFGERQPRKWTAGSENFARTQDLNAPEETNLFNSFVHVAAVYGTDGAITLYRNGKPYGQSYKTSGPILFEAGKSRILLGMRHTGGGNPFFKGVVAGARIYDHALSDGDIQEVFRSLQPAIESLNKARVIPLHSKTEMEQLKKEIAELQKQATALKTTAVSYIGKRVQPEPTRFLKRGDINSPMDTVKPGALSRQAAYANFTLPVDAPEGERRKALAEWMTDEKNPLTARVMVNRFWHYHFGQGLVATPSDFGNSGTTPTHPELLDWLARQFMEDGWSLKKLHKLILSSAAFRQSSGFNSGNAAKDSSNTLLWRFSPRRLQAEEVRDSLLALSGELNKQTGGPGFRPFTEVKFGSSAFFPEDKIGPEFNRRSVYRMNVNSGKDPMLDAFDCPDPSVKTPKRSVTTTPMQALALMNNSFVQRQAATLAEKLKKNGNTPEQIKRATELAWGRSPSDQELQRAAAFVEKQGLEAYVWALFNSTEFLYVQ